MVSGSYWSVTFHHVELYFLSCYKRFGQIYFQSIRCIHICCFRRSCIHSDTGRTCRYIWLMEMDMVSHCYMRVTHAFLCTFRLPYKTQGYYSVKLKPDTLMYKFKLMIIFSMITGSILFYGQEIHSALQIRNNHLWRGIEVASGLVYTGDIHLDYKNFMGILGRRNSEWRLQRIQ